MTAYDLVPTRAYDRRPRFATYTIKRGIAVPSARAHQLVRWLSTDAGYVTGVYGGCGTDPPIALGLRLARGPVRLDLVMQCGQIALGAGPYDVAAAEMGTLAVEVIVFLETLRDSLRAGRGL